MIVGGRVKAPPGCIFLKHLERSWIRFCELAFLKPYQRVCKPAEKHWLTRRFARPFFGLYIYIYILFTYVKAFLFIGFFAVKISGSGALQPGTNSGEILEKY